MSIFALEINKNERVGTLRFSLWKPSPSALWFFSFKSWWLAGAGFVARGRHLMVPELIQILCLTSQDVTIFLEKWKNGKSDCMTT